MAKPRHRDLGKKGKGSGKYSPCKVKENALAVDIKKAFLEKYGPIEINYPVVLFLEIVSRRKLTGDNDNYEKFVYDALQKSNILKNDNLIWENHTRREMGDEDTIEIVITPYRDDTWSVYINKHMIEMVIASYRDGMAAVYILWNPGWTGNWLRTVHGLRHGS
jgi:Holliday junction resolvase RusA-like endonuclease